MPLTNLPREGRPEESHYEHVYRYIFEQLGIKVRRVRKGRHFTGRTIHVDAHDDDWDVCSNLAHELGHFLAADAKQRKTENWGLGPSYPGLEYGVALKHDPYADYIGLVTKKGVSYFERLAVQSRILKDQTKNEERASMLGLILRARIEKEYRCVLIYDFQEQSWAYDKAKEICKTMLEEGLLTRVSGFLYPKELVDLGLVYGVR